jgi:hypothetical protein
VTITRLLPAAIALFLLARAKLRSADVPVRFGRPTEATLLRRSAQ